MLRNKKLVLSLVGAVLALSIALAHRHLITRTADVAVTHVADGDTISVMLDGNTEKVRLLAIDCPEMAQPFGREAKARTEELVLGKTVSMTWRTRDKYGRILAGVALPDKQDLGQVLVGEGLAWRYRNYNDAKVETLEAEARAARRGLWANPNPTAPWEYRAAHPR